jgi:hypothetical protein
MRFEKNLKRLFAIVRSGRSNIIVLGCVSHHKRSCDNLKTEIREK